MADPVRLTLRHPRGVSRVAVGAGALAACADELAAFVAGRTCFLVTSPRVRELHGERLAPVAAAAGHWTVLEVPEGEAAKAVEVATSLWRRMLAAGGKRDSRLVTLGGGSVGDLGGFVAGCFLRGIAWAQVPTTLLAQVDASVGGKTAVDLPEGKNTVGLFHHPELVVADTVLLATLPAGELRSGLVEVVKMAMLLDPELFERLEADLEGLLAGEAEELAPVVAAAVRAKIGVVADDPEEGDRRRLLNFGHTLGHALEAALDYRRLRHGEAVAWGILFALELAERRGLERATGDRLRRLLAGFSLPPLPHLDPDELMALMERDKKARESGLVWVLPADLGEGRMVEGIPAEEVRRALEPFLARAAAGRGSAAV